MPKPKFPRPQMWLVLCVLLAAVAVLPWSAAPAADHRDGPIFANTQAAGEQDINDIFVFQSPANANNTVFVFTFQPFPGVLTPATADPATVWDINIDTQGGTKEELTLRTAFGPPNANGVQDVSLTAISSKKDLPTGVVAQGKTGQNIPIAGGGMYRSAVHDDPFFFDAAGLAAFLAQGTGTFPRPKPANPANPQPGEARNFFGPAGNTFAIIVEIPTARIAPKKSIIGVWVTSIKNGAQVDRQGRPAINTALIPPVPRNNLTRGDRRTAFNLGHPRNDFRDFRADMVSVLTTVYGRSQPDANHLTELLLPDILLFEVGNPSGFGTFIGPGGKALGNGRRFSNDVIDIDLTVITNGAITTDNVGDDNGLKVTDGSVDPVSGQTRAIAFPYIGAANNPATGPNS